MTLCLSHCACGSQIREVLLPHSGHVLSIDFDQPCDMPERRGPLEVHDFCATPYYMAPVVADQVGISTKAGA